MPISYKIDNKILLYWLIGLITLLIVTYGLIFNLDLHQYTINPEDSIEPSFVNGLLTAYSIIFAFSSFELRSINTNFVLKSLFTLPLISTFIFVVLMYSKAILTFGNLTFGSFINVSAGLFFTIVYILELYMIRTGLDDQNTKD